MLALRMYMHARCDTTLSENSNDVIHKIFARFSLIACQTTHLSACLSVVF